MRMDCADRRKTLPYLFLALLQLGSVGSAARAAVVDDFEGPQVSWMQGEADAGYQLVSHQRVQNDAHSGRSSELIQLTGQTGSYVYFTHSIGTARIIQEFAPSVWIKANRPGIQLMARVVLPHSVDPRTKRPIATFISGSAYTSVGVWQQLRIGDTPLLLARQEQALQLKMGSTVDVREAYVDQLLLNVYGGPGDTTVDIDDLKITGAVPRDAAAQPIATTATDGSSIQKVSAIDSNTSGTSTFTGSKVGGKDESLRQVALSGSTLVVNGRRIFPRIIDYQGEPLTWLKQLGFNTVRITGPLTDALLTEAQQADIRLIGSAPQANLGSGENPVPVAEIGAKYAPVLAWNLGSATAASELEFIASQARQLRQSDRQLRRPLMCSAGEDVLAFTRQVDILSASRPVAGTSLELKDYGTWLNAQMQLARTGTPVWTVIQTQPAPSLIEQTSLLAGRQILDPVIDSDTLRLQVYQAFLAGVRGLEFASSSRLDGNDNSSRIRAASLALLNLELELMEPWGAAGSYIDTVTSSDPAISGAVFNADGARLVVVTRCPKGSQFVPAPTADGTSLPTLPGAAPPPAPKPSGKPDNGPALKGSKPLQRSGSGNPMDKLGSGPASAPNAPANPLSPSTPAGPITLIVPGVPDGHDVWALTPAGIEPLRYRRVSGGTAIAIEDFPLTSLVLITPDPLVINFMQRRTAELAPSAAKLQRELAQAMLEKVASVSRRFPSQAQLPPVAASLAEAQADLQQADKLLATGDWNRAYFAARNATLPLGRWKREVWQRTAGPLQSPVSSPLAVAFDTLPEQAGFAAFVAAQPQGDNLLLGGNFEDLSTMLAAGWKHFEHPPADVQTSVELSPTAPFGERFSLRMHAGTEKPPAAGTLVESPPLWVTSAPVQVAAGDLVCLRGQVRVLAPIKGSVDGLMITDSLGGEPLAERFGQTDGWHEFVIYRIAPQNGNLTVTFALTGLGDAWIDDVSIRKLPRPMAGAR